MLLTPCWAPLLTLITCVVVVCAGGSSLPPNRRSARRQRAERARRALEALELVGGGSLVRMRKENFILVRKGEETFFFFVEFYPDTFDTSNMSHQSLCVIEKMNEYFRYLGFSSPKIINIYSFLQLAARKNWGKNTQLPRTRFRGFLRGPGRKRRWDDDFLHFGRKAAVARLLGL